MKIFRDCALFPLGGEETGGPHGLVKQKEGSCFYIIGRVESFTFLRWFAFDPLPLHGKNEWSLIGKDCMF